MRTEKSRRLGWVQKTIRTISGDRSFLFETSFVDASTENHFAFWCTKTQPNTLDPLISARTTRWISLRRIDSQYRFSLQATGFSTSKSKMLPPPTQKKEKERETKSCKHGTNEVKLQTCADTGADIRSINHLHSAKVLFSKEPFQLGSCCS